MTLADRYAAELRQVMAELRPYHQIVLRLGPDPRPGRYGQAIILSCACLARNGGSRRRGYEPIEARTLFPAADVKAAWRAWHEEQGVEV